MNERPGTYRISFGSAQLLLRLPEAPEKQRPSQNGKLLLRLPEALNTSKVKLIEGNGLEARQTSEEQTKMPRFRLESARQCLSFVLRSYTMHELRNQHVSIG